jgi:hypothetical protein
MVYRCLKEIQEKPLAFVGDFALDACQRFDDETHRRC